MKRLLLPLLLIVLSITDSYSQITFPTNREIYNFSVGDTFVYAYWHYSDECPVMYMNSYFCNQYYVIVVTSKNFSLDSTTVNYSYKIGGWSHNLPFEFPGSYSNLDSAVFLPPYPNDSVDVIDTAYIDSISWCRPLLKASTGNRYGLSDFFNQSYVSGLGKVNDYYVADNGSEPYADYSILLVYYHKDSIICGTFDSTWVISSIAEIHNTPGLKFYPNPVEDVLRLERFIQNEPYFIYDAAGRICDSGIYQNEISVQNLASGIYFVKTLVDGEVVLGRFVKQ